MRKCIDIKGCLHALLSAWLGIYLAIPVFGQDSKIELGPGKIGKNQLWTITVTVENQPLKTYSGFPDIKGFHKRGTSTRSQTSIVNGNRSSSQSVIMQYVPVQQGVFTLSPFKMKINGRLVSSPGKKIEVGAPVQQRQRDPFHSFFDQDPTSGFFDDNKTEFVDIKDDALLALSTNKSEVYTGEGFGVTLSFLVPDGNQAPMQFYNLGQQLSGILKKIKPPHCWEENFNIEDVKGEAIRIEDKRYTQYKIYQAVFYPLNAQRVFFPRVGLKMIKFKVAKNPSFFGQNRKEDYKIFYSKPKTVTVKKLPSHLLSESVAVGDYQLDEELEKSNANTGESVLYRFSIYGEGNISAIERPHFVPNDNFDLYDPNIKQEIQRMNGRVAGTKSFSYYIIPKEPGKYALKDYFSWVFFNPKTGQYDTLQSQKKIIVTGASQKNQAIESVDVGSFYNAFNDVDNTLSSSANKDWIRWGINIFIVLLFAGCVVLMFKK